VFSEMHLRRQISNVVASEGIDRFERDRTFSHGYHRTNFCTSEASFSQLGINLDLLQYSFRSLMLLFFVLINATREDFGTTGSPGEDFGIKFDRVCMSCQCIMVLYLFIYLLK
jgi:hypothetical protein